MTYKLINIRRVFIIIATLFVCFGSSNAFLSKSDSTGFPAFPIVQNRNANRIRSVLDDPNITNIINSFGVSSVENSLQSNKIHNSNNFASSLLAPPANDNFNNAFTLSGSDGETFGTTVEATIETNEPSQTGTRTVWYKWRAPSSGSVRFGVNRLSTTCLLGIGQKITVYTGSSLTNLSFVAQDSDGCSPNTSEVTFQATQNQEYKIVVDASRTIIGIVPPPIILGIDFQIFWLLTPTPQPPVTISGSLGTVTGGSLASPVQVNINCTTGFQSSQTTTGSFSFTNVPFSTTGTCTVTPSTSGPNGLFLSYSPSSSPPIPQSQNTPNVNFTLVGPQVNVLGKINNIQDAPGTTVKVNNANCSSQPNASTGNYTCANAVVVNTNGYVVIPSHSTSGFTPSNQSLPGVTSSGDILNINFTPIRLSISGNSITEGNSGTVNLEFTVSLSAPSSQEVRMSYSTANGSALAGQDFMGATNQPFTIPANQTSRKIIIPIIGDTIDEDDEQFTVSLSNPQGATIPSGQGAAIGTINDDDTGGAIQFSAANYTVNEGAGTASIEVRRTGGAASGVTVICETVAGGTATANQDYTVVSRTLTFDANVASQLCTVSIIDDSTLDPGETIFLNLRNQTGGATLGSPTTAVLTIIDNDSAPTFSISSPAPKNEGNSGTTAFEFTVTLSGQSSQTVTVNFATENGSAVAPDDFEAKSGSLSFAPGDTSKIITVLVKGDTTVELDETFKVKLSGASVGVTIANEQATGTIQNDDVPCQYALSSPGTTVSAGSSNGSFNVQTTAGCQWNAQSNNSWIKIASGNTGTGTAPVTFSIDPNNGAARTGTITAAEQTYAVNQAAGTVQRRSPADFDGDRKTDLSIFRPAVGEWWYLRSSDGGNRTFQFGNSSDKLVPADYTGDGKTDIAFFRPSTNEWFILRSEDNSFFSFPFGTNGDVPAPADFDGDGKADAAIFRPSNQTWFIQRSTGGTTIEQFGISGDVPVTSDYDGDGKSDIAIYRPSQGQWWLLRSSLGIVVYQFGSATDKLVQGDYTGDGKTDVAFFRPSTNEWFVLRSEDNSFYSFPFGTSGDVPSPGDYDGDGRADAAVFRPSNNTWFAQRSTAGGILIQGFGIAGDRSVPNTFVP